MRLTLATAILLIGCGGGNKPDKTVPDTTGDTAPTGDPVPVSDETVGGAVDGSGDYGTIGHGSGTGKAPDTGGYKLVLPSDLVYAPLNPDGPGPELAVANGDPKTGGAFFLRVPPGGKSGLHSHTNDYHAVVISGAPRHWLAGTDKKAKPLAPGSYWFQPGGQPHGDDCTGTDPCVLYIIMNGAFDSTATPKAKKGAVGKYSMTARKDAKFAPVDPAHPEGIKAAFVHGDPKTGPVGFLIEVPPGGNSGLHSHTSAYHAVVLDGAPAHWLPHEKGEGEPLAVGSYWFQPGGYDHGDRCTSAEPCHGFVFMEGAMDFKPAAPAATK